MLLETFRHARCALAGRRVPAAVEYAYKSRRIPDDGPPVAPAPAATTGHVTFGSFNGCYKITPTVARTWARVLREVPGSRLRLFTIDGDVARQRLIDLFAANGIAPGRLDLVPRMSHDEFLRAHGGVDIALDAFPYHGTTTTCFSLWMGLPVVALAGSTHVSRVGMTLLSSIGLPHLASTTDDDYVATAVALASDASQLERLRAGMRDRIRGSVLADGLACARALERAYRSMWRAWCERRTGD